MQAENKINIDIWRYGNFTEIGITETGFATGWGSNPGGMRDFLPPSRLALGHTQPIVCITPIGSFQGIKRPGRGVDHNLNPVQTFKNE